MAYMMAIGHCASCHAMFSFNPDCVPSVRIDGVKEPICKTCMEWANQVRKEQGLEPHFIHPQAYEPVDENPRDIEETEE